MAAAAAAQNCVAHLSGWPGHPRIGHGLCSTRTVRKNPRPVGAFALRFAYWSGYRIDVTPGRGNVGSGSSLIRPSAQATLDAARRAKEVRESLAAAQAQAVEDARVRYGAEVAKRRA
jgi:hypothetical protein